MFFFAYVCLVLVFSVLMKCLFLLSDTNGIQLSNYK